MSGGSGGEIPYGTPARATPRRISLTCVATCGHGNACTLVGERDDQVVSLYFHGTQEHGLRLTPGQRGVLGTWLLDPASLDAAPTDPP